MVRGLLAAALAATAAAVLASPALAATRTAPTAPIFDSKGHLIGTPLVPRRLKSALTQERALRDFSLQVGEGFAVGENGVLLSTNPAPLWIVTLDVLPPLLFALLHGAAAYRLRGILVFTVICIVAGNVWTVLKPQEKAIETSDPPATQWNVYGGMYSPSPGPR